jgi:hypothetical protein
MSDVVLMFAGQRMEQMLNLRSVRIGKGLLFKRIALYNGLFLVVCVTGVQIIQKAELKCECKIKNFFAVGTKLYML